LPKNLPDIATVGDIVTLRANANDVAGRSNIGAGFLTQGDVVATTAIELERIYTDGRVTAAGVV
jgi:hypothetical protein